MRAVLLDGDWADLAPAHLEGVDRLASADLLSAAALEGDAVGPGAQLLLAVDLLVMAEAATLAFPEVRSGSVPASGASGRLAQALGWQRALELCATGRPLGASEAVAAGLAVAVAPAGAAERRVEQLLDSALSAPRGALVEAKALLRGAAARSPAEQCEAEREAVQRLRSTPDQAPG